MAKMRMNQISRFTYIIVFFIALNITSFVSSECNGGSLQKVEDFKVKGLYLGMDIEDARKIFKEKGFNVGKVVTIWEEWLSFSVSVFDYYPLTADLNNGKVLTIDLNTATVNELFNVEGVAVETYIQAFMDNYGIPEMKLDPTGVAWEYTFPIGIYIVIFTDKQTIIKKVSAPSEFSFD